MAGEIKKVADKFLNDFKEPDKINFQQYPGVIPKYERMDVFDIEEGDIEQNWPPQEQLDEFYKEKPHEMGKVKLS